MSIVKLHTVPKGDYIKNDETSLCVFDPNGNLMADYDFCTGLHILGSENGLTIYINDDDLIPGSWVLLLTTMNENFEPTVRRVEGFKEGTSKQREFSTDYPWADCGPNPSVTKDVRQHRLSTCMSCSFLDLGTMACIITNKPVLDTTTIPREYCPEDFWGDKQQVIDVNNEQAMADGIVPDAVPSAVGVTITPEDQAQFEAELEDFFGGL